MTFEAFFGKAIDSIIEDMAKNIGEQIENQERERKHAELKEGSIDVEFRVKEDEIKS